MTIEHESAGADGRRAAVHDRDETTTAEAGVRNPSMDSSRNADAHLRLVADLSPDLILILDRDAKVRYTNRTLPESAVEGVLPSTEEFQKAFRDVSATGEPREAEIALGHSCWLTRFVPVKADDGAVAEVLVIASDITDRKMAERGLRESESRFRTLADSTSAAIFVVQESRVVYANRAAETITGYSLAEMTRMWYWDLVHPEHRERSKQWAIGREKGLEVPGRFEVKLVTKDGEERWVDYSASIFELSGSPAIVGTAVDITDRIRAEEERRRLEAQMQHSQRLDSLGLLAGGIAHDFNNLLTGILGSASLAAMKLPKDSPAAEQISRVLASAEKACELTNKMLNYAGKGQILLVPSDLNRVIEDVLPLVRASVGKTASIQLALAPNLPEIEADGSQIQQVVVNLLTNAAEALAREIVVRTGAMTAGDLSPHASVFLEVKDDGTGMDEETRARIFDPFFTTKFTGRGLGLSAVAGIVSGHGGKIRVESARDRGTSFTVLFPSKPTAKPDEARGVGELRSD